MKIFTKLALVALLTTSVALPTFAQETSGRGGSAGSGSTVGSSGTGTNSSGNVGARGNTSTNTSGASTPSRVGADVGTGNISGGAGADTNSSTGATESGTGSASASGSFLSNDSDRSGGLSLNEYRSYTGTVGANARIQDDFRALDLDGNNFLSESELNARTGSSIR